MSKRLGIAAAALWLALAGAPAWAVKDGNELLSVCTAKNGSFDQGFCAGYVQGVMVVTEFWQMENGGCFFAAPENVTIEQMMAVVVKKMQDRPEIRSDPAAVIVVGSAKSAWPCAGGQ